jgi:hypothetical protein
VYFCLHRMTTVSGIARHFREVHFGGNWTWVNVRDTLQDVTWEEALHRRDGFNTIAMLAFHIHYFVAAVRQVLEGGPLDAHDKFSFTHPPIGSDANWQQLLQKMWTDAERFAELVERLPDERLHTAWPIPSTDRGTATSRASSSTRSTTWGRSWC